MTSIKNIDCFGTIQWDSNFEIVCDDEMFDGICADVDTIQHNSWAKVVEYLLANYRDDIVQITAC